MNRPYKAPLGKLGCYVTTVLYILMLIFADRLALVTAGVISALCVLYWAVLARKREGEIPSIEEEIGVIEEPTEEEKKKLDKEYSIWKVATIVVTVVALGIYLIPIML